MEEVGDKYFPVIPGFFLSLSVSSLGSLGKLEEAGLAYLGFVPPPGAGRQLLRGDHTHDGNDCCSVDFKQT